MKKPKHMLTGVNIGDYGFSPEIVMDRVKKLGFGKENGGLFNYLSIRLRPADIPAEKLYEWAEYFRDNGIYFKTSGNYPRIGEIDLRMPKEVAEKMQQIAGEYYIADGVGEFGSWYATKAKGYFKKGTSENPVQGMKNCKEAKETYISQLRKVTDKMREGGIKEILSTQAVTLLPYDFEAGVDITNVETAPGNMEQILNFGRGAIRAYGKNILGNWLAHEFYGGYHQFDPLKAKRFTAEYYLSYLAGCDFICLESGAREIYSHVDEMLPEGHPLPTSYYNEAASFARFCNEDIRPGEDGPITKVAFVQGNLDGFGAGDSSSLWGQYYDKQWGHSAPEHSYKILDEVYRSIEWHDNKNFGDYDYSGAPGYGVYDVIPATAPIEALRRYEYIIFCGWNTMTPEIAKTFMQYVEEGGNLLITAAHMRDSIERGKKGNFCDVDWEKFLGVKLTDKTINVNDGFKFVQYSTIDGVMYPGTKTLMCDPAYSSGYTDYVVFEPTDATTVCYISDSFGRSDISTEPTVDNSGLIPVITENKYGKGNVIFMGTSEYPGAREVFNIYKVMVKSLLAASHRNADLKVIGSDKIRFAMYEDENTYKLYVFNSDFNNKQFVKVIFNGEEREIIVNSVGLEIIEYKK